MLKALGYSDVELRKDAFGNQLVDYLGDGCRGKTRCARDVLARHGPMSVDVVQYQGAVLLFDAAHVKADLVHDLISISGLPYPACGPVSPARLLRLRILRRSEVPSRLRQYYIRCFPPKIYHKCIFF